MAAGGDSRAVVTALFANFGIAIAKFVGFVITRSSSMLAESIHSLADTTNQALLLLGGRRARRDATDIHQFGFGRERYFWSFVVALLLFSVGGGYALFEGVEKIRHPHEVKSLGVAIGILIFAIVLEGYALYTAYRAADELRGERSWWQFIRTSRNPELPVVLLEDSGAMLGLLFALGGVTMAQVTDNPRWDGIGTLAIGIILCLIAITLAIEMKSLLIGESANAMQRTKIQEVFESDPAIDRVLDIKSQHIGPEDLLIVAKVKFDDSLSGDALAEEIDHVHQELKEHVPHSRFIYIEPDLHDDA